MMYSKGDTIKFQGGRLALVLDKGMDGEEFHKRHGRKDFCEIFWDGFTLTTSYPTNVQLIDSVWYPILMGDVKGWRAISTKEERAYDDRPE